MVVIDMPRDNFMANDPQSWDRIFGEKEKQKHPEGSLEAAMDWAIAMTSCPDGSPMMCDEQGNIIPQGEV
jgi:hypothetical protein